MKGEGIKILILENEVYNYHLLRHLLEDMSSDYDIIGPILSVEHGREYLALHKDVDLIIADVQLSDGLSFDVLSHAPSDVPIIFTATSEDHARKAFDFYSLSYLMKPISGESLTIAIRKAHLLIDAKVHHYMDSYKMRKQPQQAKYRERFVVKSFNGERIISLSTVQYIFSEHKSTYLVLFDGTSCPIDLSLEAVASQLDPMKFMRVNRKYIVPAELVGSMERLINGKELLKLKITPSPEIIVSRTRKAQVRKWLDK